MKFVRNDLAKLQQDDQELQRHVAALDSVWDGRSIALLGNWFRCGLTNAKKAQRPD